MSGDALWVFGYGSLIWRPGFPFAERAPATLTGFNRSFCVYSTHHRGTERRPGLVLGLDIGGVCHGCAYRVAASDAAEVLSYLRAREQVNGVYREVQVPVDVRGAADRRVLAIAYIVERAHPSYAGRLSPMRQAELIRAAEGISGPNIDYLANAVDQLPGGFADTRALSRVLALVHPFFRRSARNGAASSPSARALVAASRAQGGRVRQPKRAERRRFLYRMNCPGLSVSAGS
ncbi:MAG: gamma-glutamylcyclotransferase [Pseudomonadota bacterium]